MLKSAPVPLGGVIEIPLSVVSVRSKGFDRLQDFSWTIIPLLTSGANGRKKTKRLRPTVLVHLFLLLQPPDARETEGRSSGSGHCRRLPTRERSQSTVAVRNALPHPRYISAEPGGHGGLTLLNRGAVMAGRYVEVHPTVNHTTICRWRNLHHDERAALEEGIGEGKPQCSASTAHFLSSSTPATSALCRRWRGQIRRCPATVRHDMGRGRCAIVFSVDPSLLFASKKSQRRRELRRSAAPLCFPLPSLRPD